MTSQDTSAPETVTPPKPAQAAGDYVLVPREPTWEMRNKGAIAALECLEDQRSRSHSGYAEVVTDAYRAMLAASPALQPQPADAPDVPGAVTVKPLEWARNLIGRRNEWFARACGYTYDIEVGAEVTHLTFHAEMLGTGYRSGHPNLEAAKAAAQADYAARILSAITPKPAPSGDDVALREALQAVYDWQVGSIAMPPAIREQIRAALAAQSSASQEPVAEVIGTTYDGVDILAPAVPSKNFTPEEVRKAIAAALATPETAGRAERLRGEFTRGYVIAVSNLVNMHGASTEAVDTMMQLGVSFDEITELDLVEYDAAAMIALRDYDGRAFALQSSPDAKSDGGGL